MSSCVPKGRGGHRRVDHEGEAVMDRRSGAETIGPGLPDELLDARAGDLPVRLIVAEGP